MGSRWRVIGLSVLVLLQSQAYAQRLRIDSVSAGPSLVITLTSLPDADEGFVYTDQAITVANATGAVTCAITSGTQPPGLTLAADCDPFGGTPTTPGSYTFTVTATDSVGGAGHTATRVYAILINAIGASYYLDSDTEFWYTMTNGSGPAEIGRSNGAAYPDGANPLVAGGVTFSHGFGVSAASSASQLRYKIRSTSTSITGSYGVDDQITTGASVVFSIESPCGSAIHTSGTLTQASSNVNFNVSLPASPTEVCLRMTDAGSASANDMGVWGNVVINGASSGTDPCSWPSVVTVTAGSSIASAIATAGANGVICLGNGTHRLNAALTPLSGQTFVGASLSAEIRGSTVLGPFTAVGSPADYFVTGQTQAGNTNYYGLTNPNRPEDHCVPPYGITDQNRCANPEDLYLDGVKLLHATSLGACTLGWWFFDYTNDRIYVCKQDPATHTVETTVQAQMTQGTADDVRFLRVKWGYFAAPIQRYTVYGGNRWRFEGIECYNAHGACANLMVEWVIRNSYMHHCGEYGVGGDEDKILFEGNELAYNGDSGVSEYWGSGGSKFATSADATARGNYTHHNYGPGLWWDVDNRRWDIDSNRSEYNTRAAYMWEISYTATFRNNTSKGNGSPRATFDDGVNSTLNWPQNGAIEILNSNHVEVYGHVSVDDLFGITAFEDCRGQSNVSFNCTGVDPSSCVASDSQKWCVDAINVHDNITIHTTAPATGRGFTAYGDLLGTDTYTKVTYEANHYCFRNNGSNYFELFPPSFSPDFRSDSNWQAAQPTGRGHDDVAGGGSIVRSNTLCVESWVP